MANNTVLTAPRSAFDLAIVAAHTCPIHEVSRLGHTFRAWRAQVLAYFDTSGVSNGGTEAINLIIEKIRRLAHGFKDLITTDSESCSPPTAEGRTEIGQPML